MQDDRPEKALEPTSPKSEGADSLQGCVRARKTVVNFEKAGLGCRTLW